MKIQTPIPQFVTFFTAAIVGQLGKKNVAAKFLCGSSKNPVPSLHFHSLN